MMDQGAQWFKSLWPGDNQEMRDEAIEYFRRDLAEGRYKSRAPGLTAYLAGEGDGGENDAAAKKYLDDWSDVLLQKQVDADGYDMRGDEEWQQQDVLEMLWDAKNGDLTFGKKLAKYGAASWGRYVFRALTAADSMFWNTAKEGKAWD